MNKTSEYDFTIIMPAYNEVDNMDMVEKRMAAYIASAKKKTCVIFVDDGSTDGTGDKLEEICGRNDHMFYLRFAKNCGITAAIKAGIDAAESPLVGYIDADLQTAPEDFDLLLPYADDHELVTGIRANRKDTTAKRFQSRFANGFRRAMTGDDAVDTGCPLKVMHRHTARRLPMFKGMHRFIPALVGLQNGRIKQVPVRHFPRVAGKSKFNLRNRFLGPLADCFAFRWMRPRWYNYDISKNNL